MSGISDRKQEIKRRRHRRKQLTKFQKKLKKATVSEKAMIAEKIRRMTPGAETIIKSWKLDAKDGEDLPTEDIDFSFVEVLITYQPQTTQGVAGNPRSFQVLQCDAAARS